MSYSTAIVAAAAVIASAIVWASQPAHTQTDIAPPAFMIASDARPGFVWRLDLRSGEMMYCEASALGSGCTKVRP